MADNKTRTVDKWKNKKWFKVFSSKLFGEREIASIVGIEPEGLAGRTIEVNARDLVRDIRSGQFYLKFKISGVQGLNASTFLASHDVQPGYLRRLVRRRSSKIEIVQTLMSRDNESFKIKAACISVFKLDRSKRSAIQKMIEENISELAKKYAYENFIKESLFGNVLEDAVKKIKKIAPVKKLEIVKSVRLTQAR